MSFRAFFLACALAWLTGCGSATPTAEVSGTITVKGKPPSGPLTVTFFPDGGNSVMASVGTDGKYTAANVPVGMVRVGIAAVATADSVEPDIATMKPPEDPAQMPAFIKKMEDLERKRQSRTVTGLSPTLADPLRSGLTTTVTAPKTTFDHDVR